MAGGKAVDSQSLSIAVNEGELERPHIPHAQGHLPSPQVPPEQSDIHWGRNIVLIFLLLLVIGAGFVGYKSYQLLQSVNTYKVAARVEPYELKEGSNLPTVVNDLAGKDYPELILKVWIKLNKHYFPMIQQGKYDIDGTKTLAQLLADMREGNVIKLKLPSLSIVEGMNIYSIMRRLTARKDLVQNNNLAQILMEPRDFIRATLAPNRDDQSLLQAVGGVHDSLEGLLMPATYNYESDQSDTLSLVTQALLKMANFMREQYLDRNQSIDDVLKTPYDVLILASIVERESSLTSERPIIAGVFINRLRKGIKLQTDPTVMYGVSPDFKGPLRRSHLQKDTPYNTYTNVGLPPTPIAMPSAESIAAVFNPSVTDALFFVAKGPDPLDGHYFSATLAEHNKAVAAYRKAVSEYKKAHKDD